MFFVPNKFQRPVQSVSPHPGKMGEGAALREEPRGITKYNNTRKHKENYFKPSHFLLIPITGKLFDMFFVESYYRIKHLIV